MNKTEMIERNNGIQNQIDEVISLKAKARTQMKEAIYDMVSEMGGAIDVNWDDDSDYPILTYDGGNHPEYASTLYSSLSRVDAVLKDGVKTFKVDIEDATNYAESRMDFSDVVQVFEYVCMRYESWFTDMEDISDDILHEFK